jgi:3-methyladenine DNA glycosylase/8-oxoguanine DNA glycosylase
MARAAGAGLVERRVDVRPPWPFALPTPSMDGLLRRRGAALQRLIDVDGVLVLVGATQPAPHDVRIGARAPTLAAADAAIERFRFALGVDDDPRPFYDRFAGDRVIGRAVRAHPELRPRRRPDPWEVLLAAITEQLIELQRAAAIQRTVIARHGSRCPRTGLRAMPAPAAVAALAPASLCAYGLAEVRAFALRRAARAVAGGEIDLVQHEPAWRALRRIPGIGAWTTEMLAFYGQGRADQLPAADVGYLKLVGRLLTGNPRARADEATVRAFFACYGPWKGLAGEYLRRGAQSGLLPDRPYGRPVAVPRAVA